MRKIVRHETGGGHVGRILDEMAQPVPLEVLDWPAAARTFLAIPEATLVSVEGHSVPDLESRFPDERVDRRIGKATLFASDVTDAATFLKSPRLVEALMPLLDACDWSVFHLNLHDDERRLVEGYDWGEGCCPVSVAADLGAVIARLLDEGVARRWPEDDE